MIAFKRIALLRLRMNRRAHWRDRAIRLYPSMNWTAQDFDRASSYLHPMNYFHNRYMDSLIPRK